jgi:predicted amidohydrolase YtcJ
LAVVTSPPTLDLYTNVDDISDIQAMLDAIVAKPGEWIRGSGWDASVINVPGCPDRDYRCLNKEQLDRPTTLAIPVVFYDWTGHNLWVNSEALRIAGIDKNTPDPEGGYIARDADGNPTGILGEITAMSLASLCSHQEVLRASVLWGMVHNGFGITGYAEGCLGPGHNTCGTQDLATGSTGLGSP